MGSVVVMPLLLCSMALLFDSLCSLSLEAEPGENVTIWNDENLGNTGHIYWFKHTTHSVPLLLGCKRVTISGEAPTCYLYNETKRIVMSVHGKNTSLTITAVNLSDTGLYYCGFMQLNKMKFCKSVYLQVKVGSETLVKDEAKDFGSSSVFRTLTVVFGAVIVILLTIFIFIFIILKHRKIHSGETQLHEDQEYTSINYTALQVSYKKTERT